jgi:predicted transcriptional regulator YdeE
MNNGIHVISLPAFTLTGKQLLATPMSPTIMQLWGSFAGEMPRIHGRTEPHIAYGGMRNYDVGTQTFEYMAGVAVRADATPLSGHQCWHVPASSYAMSRACIATIGQVMDEIHQWIHASAYVHSAEPSFERYGTDFRGGVHDPIDILVAVKSQV